MNYSITVQGMHCQGCKNLITMSLEDEGMKNIQIDYKTGVTTFESSLTDKNAVSEILNKVFSQFETYKYTDLTEL